MAEAVTKTATSQSPNRPAANDRAAFLIAGLDKHLSSGPTCPEDKRAIEDALAILTKTLNDLRKRIETREANGQQTQSDLQMLNSELQKVRDVKGVLTLDIKHHRAFISLLARHITTQSQEDVAAPPSSGSIEADIRQMTRFKRINDLAVAGEDFARMILNQGKLERVVSNLSIQIAEAGKAATDHIEKARVDRATEILLGEDLMHKMRRAQEFGCVIEAARMTEDKKLCEEEIGEEHEKSVGSGEQHAENGAGEQGEVQAGPNQ